MSEKRSIAEQASGPLTGIRVVEFAGIGPGPHFGMLLADFGADVLRLDRPGGNGWDNPIMDRGRARLTLDFRSVDGRCAAADACAASDVLVEGYRPSVMERLGLGPEPLLDANPRLIYARITGWGQEGPLAHKAGHDINYIALAGALHSIGRPGEPATPPLNLVGDFGGGSLFCAFGIVAALLERERSGRGQVVDAAIIDGVASMMSMFTGLSGRVSLDRGTNPLAGAAPDYRSYRCADGAEMAVGAIEPQFWEALRLGLDAPDGMSQAPSAWSASAAWLEETFASQPLEHWLDLLADSDACIAPVLAADAAASYEHHRARQTFIEHDAITQAAPAPRFGRTPGRIQPTRDGTETLRRWREPRRGATS